jgi:hypothetical protein
MPKLNANDYRLFIESATPSTFNAVAGQISVSIDRGEVSFSTIDKASAVETTGRAMRNYAVSCEYRPDLPDTNGHTRLETFFGTGNALNIQVRKSPFGTGDSVYTASVRVSAMNTGAPLNDVSNITATLTALAAPSVDALS